jgi:hypothetical protein
VLVLAFGAGTLYIFQSAGNIYALDGGRDRGRLVGCRRRAHRLARLARAAAGGADRGVVSALVLNWTFVTTVLPELRALQAGPRAVGVIARRAGPDDAVVHYNVALPSMVYYLRRHVDVLFVPEPLFEHLRGPRTVYAVLSDEDYESLAPHMGVETCVIARTPTVNVKLRAVLAREPLPEVLLITNRCDVR